jgi:hypothetical protein
MEKNLRVNLLGPGPRLTKKQFTRPRLSQKLRNTAVDHTLPCQGGSLEFELQATLRFPL